MFTQSPINDCKIELSFENGFDLQRVLAQPIEIWFPRFEIKQICRHNPKFAKH